MRPKPVVLAIIDGWGSAPPWGGNAVTLARTPFFNLAGKWPNTTLQAAGAAVGLPENERGNSEVGHLNIGSGQIVQESLPAIAAAINDGSFYSNPVLVKAFEQANTTGNAIHIIGLATDGGIHSHIDHLFALLQMAKSLGTMNVCVHVITDGRDTPPFVAQEYCAKINQTIAQLGLGRICTVSGRYYAMDRDHRWERIEKVYRAITEGVGLTARSAEAAVAAAYREGFSDEYIIPTVIHAEGNGFRPLSDGDSVIFYNFRGDRARELTQAIVKADFNEFERRKVLQRLHFVGFTYYQEGLPIEVAFRPRDVEYPLSRVLSEAKLKQLHVAESEKYAHVTYFFNGGHEQAYPGEDREVVPSPRVPSYDQVPAMSSDTITETVITRLKSYDFIVLNYACPDMVGHTGNLRAAILAVEAVDKSLAAIWQAVAKLNGILIVTADHGNVEQMVNPKTGEPDTEHTNSPVPFVLLGSAIQGLELRSGVLADIAPTILELLGLSLPPEMTGTSLILRPQEASATETTSQAAIAPPTN